MAKYDDLKKQLRAAIAEAEQEVKRLRQALDALESAGTDSHRAPVERRPRRSPIETHRMQLIALELVSLNGGQGTVPDVHRQFVQLGDLEDTKRDLEVVRNLLRGLVRAEQLEECGRGVYCLPQGADQSPFTVVSGGGG